MTLTKLSRKYHRLKAEGKLRAEAVQKQDQPKIVVSQESLNVSEDPNFKDKFRKKKLYSSPQQFLELSSEEARKSHRTGSFSVSSVPSGVIPDVVRQSTSESEPSDRRESVASTISRFSAIPKLRQVNGTKRTDCAGWRRMESTHLDHLDEEGHDNVSLVTEDYSAIPALDDSSMTFYTAKNSVRQSIDRRRTSIASSKGGNRAKLQGNRRSCRSAPRRSILGRNEVILLSSESDSSPERENAPPRIENGSTFRHPVSKNMQSDDFFSGQLSRNIAMQPLTTLMSKAKIATVQNWIVSSPFQSERKLSDTSAFESLHSTREQLQNTWSRNGLIVQSVTCTKEPSAPSLISTSCPSKESDATSKRQKDKKIESYRNSESNYDTLSEATSKEQRRHYVGALTLQGRLYPNLIDILETSESEIRQSSEDNNLDSEATSKRFTGMKENSFSSEMLPSSEATSKTCPHSEDPVPSSEATSKNYPYSEDPPSSEATSKNYPHSEDMLGSEATSKGIRDQDPTEMQISTARIYPDLTLTKEDDDCRALQEFYVSRQISNCSVEDNHNAPEVERTNSFQIINKSGLFSIQQPENSGRSSPKPLFSLSDESSELSRIQKAIALQVSLASTCSRQNIEESQMDVTVSQATTLHGRLRLSFESENSLEENRPNKSPKESRNEKVEESPSLLANEVEPQTSSNSSSQASENEVTAYRNEVTPTRQYSLVDNSRKVEDIRLRLLRSNYGLLASTRKADHFVASSSSSSDEEENVPHGRVLIYTSDESESGPQNGLTIIPQSPSSSSDSSSTKETSAKGDPTFIPSTDSEEETEVQERRQSIPKNIHRRRVLGPVIHDSQLHQSSDEEESIQGVKSGKPQILASSNISPFVTFRRGSRTPLPSSSNEAITAQPAKFCEGSGPQLSTNTPNIVLMNSPSLTKSSLPYPDDISTPPASPFRPLNLLANSRENFATPKVYHGKLSFLASLSFDDPSDRCHPDAVRFVTKFKLFKEQLLAKLFKLFNEKAFESCLPENLPISWNPRLTKTAGVCIQRRVIHKNGGREERSSRIELSTKVLDSADRLRDTLIHEMCHAASWMISGYRDGHGPEWKAWAQKAMNKFPELPMIARCHSYPIRTKYTYKCTNCFYQIGRHSKSIDVEKKCCGLCKGRFELIINGKLAKSGPGKSRNGPATPNGTPNKFAMFVKENYKQCRTPGKSHSDAMKELASEFAKTKLTL